jgi:hypothetical protein
VAAGALMLNGHAGGNSVRFRGHLGRSWLPPGSYLVTVTAVGPDGARSVPRSLRFAILAWTRA